MLSGCFESRERGESGGVWRWSGGGCVGGVGGVWGGGGGGAGGDDILWMAVDNKVLTVESEVSVLLVEPGQYLAACTLKGGVGA